MCKNGNKYYHKIDCPELKENGGQITGFSNYNFQCFSVSASTNTNQQKINYYKHPEGPCYSCIVGGHYDNDKDSRDEYGDLIPENLSDNKKDAYYKAVGREKYKQYTTTNYFGDANKEE